MKLHVNTLLCKSHVHFAIPCLKSFMVRCMDDVELHIFDDGSMTESDYELLRYNFQRLVIHKYHEYYDKISDSLSKYPNCLSYRKNSPLALKLLDIPLSSPDAFVNLDSDIYFFKPFKDINRSKIEDPDFVGARDLVTHCYGLSFRDRYFNKKIPILPDKFNAGFIYMNRRIFDLDFVEWLLSSIKETKKAGYNLTEQLVYGALAANKNSFVWDYKQVKCQNPHTEPEVDEFTLAIHFHHSVRAMLFPAIENDNLEKPDMNEIVIPLKLEPNTYHNVVWAAADRISEKYILHL